MNKHQKLVDSYFFNMISSLIKDNAKLVDTLLLAGQTHEDAISWLREKTFLSVFLGEYKDEL